MAQRTLVDTHIAVWVASNAKRLSKSAKQVLSSSSEIFLSTISIAELELKGLALNNMYSGDYKNHFEKVGFEIVDFGVGAATSLRRFGQLDGHDAFDRMILAHAASLKVDLLTSDQVLTSLGLDWVIDAEA